MVNGLTVKECEDQLIALGFVKDGEGVFLNIDKLPFDFSVIFAENSFSLFLLNGQQFQIFFGAELNMVSDLRDLFKIFGMSRVIADGNKILDS